MANRKDNQAGHVSFVRMTAAAALAAFWIGLSAALGMWAAERLAATATQVAATLVHHLDLQRAQARFERAGPTKESSP